MTRTSLLGLAALAIAGAAAFGSIAALEPPAPLPETAPETEFSALRAMRHVEAIAARPHPVGSAESAAARDYILAELAAMGVEARVQEGVGVSSRGFAAATVRNVVARLPGRGGGPTERRPTERRPTERRPAIMLACHYDSVPAAPGAGDDAAGAAALLETARALGAGPPLANDVILLFTDGEEAGLLGADAFVREDPWAGDVALAMNFEGRGTAGPVFLFETSPGNADLIEAVAGRAPHPMGSSLAYTVYELLPNDTDFTFFKRAGMRGLNFAFVDNVRYYHTSHDAPAALDRGTLQHHGSYALALARHFGEADLAAAGAGGNAVYFNPVGSWLVWYPEGWVLPIWAAALALFAAVAALAVRRGVSLGRVAVAAAGLLAAVAAAGGAAWLFMWAVRLAHAGPLPPGRVELNGYYGSAAALLAAGAVAAASAWLGGRRGRVAGITAAAGVAVGGLVWYAALATATSLLLPGTSYLFVWPLVGAAAGAGAALLAGGRGSRRERGGAESAVEGSLGENTEEGAEESAEASLWPVALLLGGALPALAILAPTVRLLFSSFGANEIGAPAIGLFGALALLPVAPLFAVAAGRRRWAVPAALLAAAAVAAAAGAATAGYDASDPQPANVSYALDADTGEAVWASFGREPNAWTGAFLGSSPERRALAGFFPRNGSQPMLVAPAPAAALPAPEVALVGEAAVDGGRELRLRVVPPAGARAVALHVADAEVLAAAVEGRAVAPLPEGGQRASAPRRTPSWTLDYYAPPAEGVEVTLRVATSEPVAVRAIASTSGFPPGTAPAARPEATMPVQTGDQTLVSRSFRF